jgi:hypothetical protein
MLVNPVISSTPAIRMQRKEGVGLVAGIDAVAVVAY